MIEGLYRILGLIRKLAGPEGINNSFWQPSIFRQDCQRKRKRGSAAGVCHESSMPIPRGTQKPASISLFSLCTCCHEEHKGMSLLHTCSNVPLQTGFRALPKITSHPSCGCSSLCCSRAAVGEGGPYPPTSARCMKPGVACVHGLLSLSLW
jgi:hypothetical protein